MSEDIDNYRQEALSKSLDIIKMSHNRDTIDMDSHDMLLSCTKIIYATNSVQVINLTIGLMQDMINKWGV